MQPEELTDNAAWTMVLEAFADTIIPGNKRYPGDRAIAGADVDGGSVAAGAVELASHPAGGLAPALDTIVIELNESAEEYAERHDLVLDTEVPPFVALSFDARTALVQELTRPDHPAKQMWVGFAMFCNMAYDSAAHLPTAEALAIGHPGLRAMNFAQPDSDGLFRFPSFSYGRPLSELHPGTTASGSPS